jgi:8-oxo-dGTP pyrophosphatase MutT (NUDIX family)
VETGGWETLEREVHYSSPHLTVVTEHVRTPTRPGGRRWIIAHRKPAVIIGAITAAGELVLIRQERVPIRSAIWEVPAGQIDDAASSDMAAADAAVRELQEETGYELAAGGELQLLGRFYSSPGFTDEGGYFVLARPVVLSASGHAHHESESILDCRAFSPEQISRMIAEGEISDAATLGLCAKLFAAGALQLHI